MDIKMQAQATERPGRVSRRSAACGMTLVELLVSTSIFMIVIAVVGILLQNYTVMFHTNNDAVVAASRAEAVIRLLENPVHHIGLGVQTCKSDDYTGEWGSPAPIVAGWRDALLISEDNKIGILHAIPTGVKIASEVRVENTGEHVVPLLGSDASIFVKTNNRSDLRSWITIPGTDTAAPMHVYRDASPGSVNVRTSRGTAFTLPLHQEIFHVKGVWAFVDDEMNFRMIEIADQSENELYGPGNVSHPNANVVTVEKIRGARFSLSDNRKHLEVRVLAMGDSKNLFRARPIPPYLASRWDLTEDDTKHYLEEFCVKWRVRNLGERQES